jgi:hypothetical protein
VLAGKLFQLVFSYGFFKVHGHGLLIFDNCPRPYPCLWLRKVKGFLVRIAGAANDSPPPPLKVASFLEAQF